MNAREQLARELAIRAVELTEADAAEAVVAASNHALTRFAANRIHQNVAEEDMQVSVRAVVGSRQGVASTNRLDEESLRACCEAAARAASATPEDAHFHGLPGPAMISGREEGDRAETIADVFGPELRAAAARSMIDQSTSRGLTAAGSVEVADEVYAIANSSGVQASAVTPVLRASVLSMGDDGGSGWGSFVGADSRAFSAPVLGDEAATLAERSANPVDLAPGSYAVVLGPEAVAELVGFLGYVGFSVKALEEQRSFMSGRMGEQVMHPSVTIVDDALSREAMGPTFDFEGQPKRRVELIKDGVASDVVTDSYWAAFTGRENTGHALPAPNSFGPLPLNLEMAAGDSTIDELVTRVQRGVYVTRFHYVNVEEPLSATLTGMTRDGTFMIEDGRFTHPLKNLRFTQSATEALSHVLGITRERRHVSAMLGSTLVPGVLLSGFNFTGQTRD